jgi:hypothetical protein
LGSPRVRGGWNDKNTGWDDKGWERFGEGWGRFGERVGKGLERVGNDLERGLGRFGERVGKIWRGLEELAESLKSVETCGGVGGKKLRGRSSRPHGCLIAIA